MIENHREFIENLSDYECEFILFIDLIARFKKDSQELRSMALLLASTGNWLSVFRLLDSGVDINATNDCGESLLSFAVSRGNEEVFWSLICRNAKLDFRHLDGSHIAYQVIADGTFMMFRMLAENSEDHNFIDIDLLKYCEKLGRIDIIRYISKLQSIDANTRGAALEYIVYQ